MECDKKAFQEAIDCSQCKDKTTTIFFFSLWDDPLNFRMKRDSLFLFTTIQNLSVYPVCVWVCVRVSTTFSKKIAIVFFSLSVRSVFYRSILRECDQVNKVFAFLSIQFKRIRANFKQFRIETTYRFCVCWLVDFVFCFSIWTEKYLFMFACFDKNHLLEITCVSEYTINKFRLRFSSFIQYYIIQSLYYKQLITTIRIERTKHKSGRALKALLRKLGGFLFEHWHK